MERVRAELTKGQKASHWMWFVFPQIAGPGKPDVAEVRDLRSTKPGPISRMTCWGHGLSTCTQLVGQSGLVGDADLRLARR